MQTQYLLHNTHLFLQITGKLQKKSQQWFEMCDNKCQLMYVSYYIKTVLQL